MASSFVHLHNHSHYSIGDAISKIGDIFREADKFQMPAVALTDHGNMFGVAEFLSEAKKYPHIKAVVGCEMYISLEDMRQKKLSPGKKNYYHFLLLAKNETGYKNLSKLVSLASLEGFYYRPRIDYGALEEYSDGLIGSSACLGGEIPSLILQNKIPEALEKARFFKELFGPDSFFLELMNHGLPEQKIVNDEIIKIAQKLNIPLIATNDVHYPHKGDDEAHDAFLCIQEGKKINDPNRKKYHSKEFYFKSPLEMAEVFADYPQEVLTNTLFVASQCDYTPKTEKFHIPEFETPTGDSDVKYLRDLCSQNFPLKYLPNDEVAKERLEYELSVIEKMGFSSYFLIVQDFIQYAKNNDCSVGPGRGSAAGSIVSYLLGITDLDPLKYQLLFERFLNPGRISMPDIDTDFDDTKRDEIIEYVANKYGKDRVAQIVVFGRMKAKSVIRDIGRILDIPLSDTDYLSKLIPAFTSLKDAYNTIPEFKEKLGQSPQFEKMYELSLRLENSIRQISTHAAGVIIGKEGLTDLVPLHRDRKTGTIVTQFEGKNLEEFGLLKMDFLGLRNLRIIKQTLELINKKTKKTIDFSKISLDDPKTYKSVFAEGKGIAVFQCESQGMRALMKQMKPSRFEDIIALIALFRPGPLKSGMAADFIKNKKIPARKIKVPHEDIREIMSDTYGVIVYQEQIMQIAQTIAGFTLAESDNLRKAMGKKDVKQMNSMAEAFLQGAKNKGYEETFAHQLFDNMSKFAEYGFNKSHSAAYALIAFQTAYLKAHYPMFYMCAVLSSEGATVEGLAKYIYECRQMGIAVLPPDVNSSGIDFDTDGQNIRFGLSFIKNVGEKNILSIIEEREAHGPFSSIVDFSSRVMLSKKVLEGLCLGSALDSLGSNRATIMHNAEKLSALGASSHEMKEEGMVGLFEEHHPVEALIKLETREEFPQEEIWKMEKENLGFYATSHPLAPYEEEITQFSNYSILELKAIKDSLEQEEESEGIEFPSQIFLVGRVVDYQLKTTKNNDQMAILKIEDKESEIGAVIFPRIFKTNGHLLTESKAPLCFSLKIDFKKQDFQGIIQDVFSLEEAANRPAALFQKQEEKEQISTHKKFVPKVLKVSLPLEECSLSNIAKLREILEKYPGNQASVQIHLNAGEHSTTLQVGKQFQTTLTHSLLEELRNLSFVVQATL